MAYNAGVKYNNSKPAAAAPAKAAFAGNKPKTEAIFSTGLWTQEGGKSLATVQVREDVLIPAGSYINLYATDADKMTEKSPHYKIQVRPGVLKAKE